jgi:YfiH family protein
MSSNRPANKKLAENMLVFPGIPSLFSHAVFNRHGGVSPKPWHSNNVSFGLGDTSGNVYVNREQIKKYCGFRHLVSARQVHGSQVYVVREETGNDLEIEGYDGLVTNIPGIGLMIQQADCQAVFLFDPVTKTVGIVHVGWRGSVADIIAETIFVMSQAFSVEPVDIRAAVSPSLGPCCAEFINYHTELPAALHAYQVRPNYFDFWAISCDQLRTAGVRSENIQVAEICTCCNRDYFSYRRDKITGRFASAAGIK